MSATMEIIKRLFFICIAASLNTNASKLLGPQQFRFMQTPPEVARTTNYVDCYCPTFKANSVQVSSVLADNPADLERVVVYFYKNNLTSKLVMYTPGKEKQGQIPDLPYDAGDDLLTIGTETVVQLYEDILHPMSQHDTIKTPHPTNHHRLIDNTQNSGSVSMTPAAAEEFTEQHSPHAMERPILNLDWGQPGIYKNQNQNQHLHYNKDLEMESPFLVVPDKRKDQLTSHNVQYETNHNSPKNEEGSFTHWFEEQLKLLPDLAYPNSEFIDAQTLKMRIVKILRDHDINIVDEYARDEFGNNFDMTNLQLLQISIDEKVTNVRGEWSPVHIDGVMLMYLNPLHILGVIPLKKSHFLTSFHTGTRGNIDGKTSTATNIFHGRDVHGAIESFMELNKDKNQLPVSSQVNSPKASENTFVNDRLHENSKVASSLKEENTTQVYELVKDLVKTFGKYFNSDMISEVVKHLLNNPNNLSRADGPGFRIIGGNAALHSGHPLNNKARSGYVEALQHFGDAR